MASDHRSGCDGYCPWFVSRQANRRIWVHLVIGSFAFRQAAVSVFLDDALWRRITLRDRFYYEFISWYPFISKWERNSFGGSAARRHTRVSAVRVDGGAGIRDGFCS